MAPLARTEVCVQALGPRRPDSSGPLALVGSVGPRLATSKLGGTVGSTQGLQQATCKQKQSKSDFHVKLFRRPVGRGVR